jgi:hypothetical protein
MLARRLRRISRRRSGVERSAAPIPEWVLSVSSAQRKLGEGHTKMVWDNHNLDHYHQSSAHMIERGTHIPATSCSTILAACKANSGSDDPIWKITITQPKFLIGVGVGRTYNKASPLDELKRSVLVLSYM